MFCKECNVMNVMQSKIYNHNTTILSHETLIIKYLHLPMLDMVPANYVMHGSKPLTYFLSVKVGVKRNFMTEGMQPAILNIL